MSLSLDEFLQCVEDKTGDQRKKHGKYYTICCPAHDDNPKKRSLSVEPGSKPGLIAFKCHANCEKDAILKALGLSWSDVMGPKANEPMPKTYEQDGIVFPGAWDNKRVTEAYIYRDAQGNKLYAVLRTSPKGEFPQGRIEGNLWRAGLGGQARVLFDLPELLLATSQGNPTVYLPEGEKDAKAIKAQGGVATCNSGGAGKWDDSFNHFLKGCFVVIIRDKDGPGKDHARRVAASLRRSNISYKIVEAADGKDAYDHLAKGYNLDEFIDIDEDPYKFLGGKTFKMSKNSDGVVKWTNLSNFEAKIVEENHFDNGLITETFFKIEGQVEGSPVKKSFDIRAAEFAGLSWVVPNLGAKAIISPGQSTREFLRTAIQYLSDPLERIIYAQSGWRSVNGQMMFITNAGGVGVDGLDDKIEVDLERVGLKTLAVVPKEGYQQALSELERSLQPEVWVSLIGTVFLAPLRPFKEPDYALLICGESGMFKSEIAAVAQSFFGKFERLKLAANFEGTDNFVELVLHAGKDCVIVVDDYYPANDRMKSARMQTVLDKILRGVGNSSSRGRLNSASQARNGYVPRSIPIITAEKLPSGQSNTSRAYIIELEGKIISSADLTELQRMSREGLFAGAMFDYLQWIARNWERLETEIPRQFEKIRAQLASDGHKRTSANSAWILLGVWAYVEWMKSTGHLANPEIIKEIASSATKSVRAVAERSALRIDEHSYPHIFIEAIKEGLTGKRCHLASKGGSSPEDAESYGWSYHGADGLKQNGQLIGYLDKTQVWLLPDAAFAYIVDHCKKQETLFGLDQPSLWRRLLEKKYIPTEQPTTVVNLQGRSVRVVKLLRQVFEDGTEQEALPGAAA